MICYHTIFLFVFFKREFRRFQSVLTIFPSIFNIDHKCLIFSICNIFLGLVVFFDRINEYIYGEKDLQTYCFIDIMFYYQNNLFVYHISSTIINMDTKDKFFFLICKRT